MKRLLFVSMALVGCLIASRGVHAQQTDTASQQFVVTVPGNVQILAPIDVLILHDTNDANQVFPVQQWEVRGNVVNGVTTTFEVLQPFVHSVDPTDMRDAQLDIVIASTIGPPAPITNWTVDVASDSTDIANSDNDALVQISSDFVGWAFVDLTVTFVDNNFANLMAGGYHTTVVGTVTENGP